MTDSPEAAEDVRRPMGRTGQPEMVERVARAIRKAAYGSARGWHYEVEEARAAIAAMREPSDDMLDAGMNHPSADGLLIVRRGYSAMIDAALTAPASASERRS